MLLFLLLWGIRYFDIVVSCGYTILLNIFIWPVGLTAISYWVYNGSSCSWDDGSRYFNLLLLNPLNQYHPNLFLTLVTTTYLFTWMLLHQLKTPISRYTLFLYKKFLKLVALKLVVISCFTSILGSWWAFQEGSWGGWWNWDLSEYFALVIVFTFSYLIHIRSPQTHPITSTLNLVCLLALTVLLNFFVQYNLTTTSHTFGQELNRGSILNRHQLIILVAYCFLTLIISRTVLLRDILYNYKNVITWGPTKQTTTIVRYLPWLYWLTFIIIYVSVRAFTKSTTPTLVISSGVSLFFYTFTWQLLLLSLLLTTLLYAWLWSPYQTLLYCFYLKSPLFLLFFIVRSRRSLCYQSLAHLLIFNIFSLTLFYNYLTFAPNNLNYSSLNTLNFSLEKDYKVLTTAAFDTNFIQVSTIFLRTAAVNYLTVPFLEVTTGSISTYSFYIPMSYTEQRLYLTTLYTMWFGYEFEFITPLLATFMLLGLISLISYLGLNKLLRK